MKIYVTAIGSGNTLNYIHNKGYDGVLALGENVEKYGLRYREGMPDQDEVFDLKYKGVEYSYKEWIKIDSWKSTYDIGKEIIKKLDLIKEDNPKAEFHFEISAGYKRIGHIMTLISYMRDDIYKLTFLKHDNEAELLPIIKVEMSDGEKEVLENFEKGMTPGWNGKINTNKYVMTYDKNRKYIYRVLKNAKEMGLLDDNNKFSDFGKLFLEFC